MPRLQRGDASWIAWRNVATTDRRRPNLFREDDALEHGPHVGFGALEIVHDEARSNGTIERFVGKRGCLFEEARSVPMFVFD